EKTALLIDSKGSAHVVGSSTVYFMQAPGAPQVCQSDTPLTYDNIAVYRIDASGSFDLTRWLGKGGIGYTVSADVGVVSSTQAGGAIYCMHRMAFNENTGAALVLSRTQLALASATVP